MSSISIICNNYLILMLYIISNIWLLVNWYQFNEAMKIIAQLAGKRKSARNKQRGEAKRVSEYTYYSLYINNKLRIIRFKIDVKFRECE